MHKHIYNLDTLYKEDAISYYLLGAFMTDGCIYKRKDRSNTYCVTLTSKDKDWLELINQFICPNKRLLQHGQNCYRLMYMSSDMANWFMSKGCGERKSLTLQLPLVPKQYLPDFIRGCWDGDGSLSFSKSANKGKSWQSQANLTSGSLDFCTKLSDLLNDRDIKCSVYSHGKKQRIIEGRKILSNPCWRVVLSGGGSVYNLVKLIYPANVLAMPRKNKIAQDIISFREHNFMSSITL